MNCCISIILLPSSADFKPNLTKLIQRTGSLIAGRFFYALTIFFCYSDEFQKYRPFNSIALTGDAVKYRGFAPINSQHRKYDT